MTEKCSFVLQKKELLGNFTIGEKWANGIAEAFTVRYDGNKDSAVFTGSYKNITSAKIYEDGKEVQVTPWHTRTYGLIFQMLPESPAAKNTYHFPLIL